MIKKSVIIYMFSIILGFGILIFIPIKIISIDLSSYGKIEQTVSHIYAPSSPTSIQDLNLDIDVGDIKVGYVYPPINYVIKIDLSLEMEGINLTGKSISDIFIFTWQNTSTVLNLTLFLKDNNWFDKSLVLSKNLEIIVSLNAFYLFNINTNVNYEGGFDLKVPWNLSLNNIDVNVTDGNILFDFNNCILEGNVTGIVNHENGYIELKANNIELARNSYWNLKNLKGDIKYNITQEKEMGANVSSVCETDLGKITVLYKDTSPEVGAIFYFHGTNNHEGIWEGFNDRSEIDEGKWWLSRFIYDSFDFPTNSNYNISLFRNFYGQDYTFNLLNM
ncbi:MAG: hypothetical protein ACFFA3_12405 [Promethearchaeota archaeon]